MLWADMALLVISRVTAKRSTARRQGRRLSLTQLGAGRSLPLEASHAELAGRQRAHSLMRGHVQAVVLGPHRPLLITSSAAP